MGGQDQVLGQDEADLMDTDEEKQNFNFFKPNFSSYLNHFSSFFKNLKKLPFVFFIFIGWFI